MKILLRFLLSLVLIAAGICLPVLIVRQLLESRRENLYITRDL